MFLAAGVNTYFSDLVLTRQHLLLGSDCALAFFGVDIC